jgi:hypothetical protein
VRFPSKNAELKIIEAPSGVEGGVMIPLNLTPNPTLNLTPNPTLNLTPNPTPNLAGPRHCASAVQLPSRLRVFVVNSVPKPNKTERSHAFPKLDPCARSTYDDPDASAFGFFCDPEVLLATSAFRASSFGFLSSFGLPPSVPRLRDYRGRVGFRNSLGIGHSRSVSFVIFNRGAPRVLAAPRRNRFTARFG